MTMKGKTIEGRFRRLSEILSIGPKKPEEPVKGYKFVSQDLISRYENLGWELNKWNVYDGKVKVGNSGFHAYPDLYSAYSDQSLFTLDDRLFEVEARGAVSGKALFAAGEMRPVREIDLRKLSIDFAANCAEHVIPNYEKAFPEDDRPRKAIEAAENYLRDPSEENLHAARSAWFDARSVSSLYGYASAESAVESVGYVAKSADESAVESVWYVIESANAANATHAANAAKLAAYAAAKSAAWSAKEKKWQKELLEELVKKYYLK